MNTGIFNNLNLEKLNIKDLALLLEILSNIKINDKTSSNNTEIEVI